MITYKAMFGSIGLQEIILIFIVALLIFGPKKLPEIGKNIAKAIREFKNTTDEVRKTIEEEVDSLEEDKNLNG